MTDPPLPQTARCFVAVVPPAHAVAPLRTVTEQAAGRWPELRWLPAERWHLTLAFLGDVRTDRVPELASALRAQPVGPSLGLSLEGGGAFPDLRRPRVFWAGVSGDTSALSAVARGVVDVVRRAGLPLDDRPFRAHVTVARARTQFTSGGAVVEVLRAVTGPPFDVTEVVLLRSHLGPTPRYERLATAPLAS